MSVYLKKGEVLEISVGRGGIPADFFVGQQLSQMEYREYLDAGHDSSPGGETVVIFDSENRVELSGGDSTAGVIKVQSYGNRTESAVTQSGRRRAMEGSELLRTGADSSMGQGAASNLRAGMGGGGNGGRLYLGEDGDCRVLELPTQGGDGAVLIDYAGGQA